MNEGIDIYYKAFKIEESVGKSFMRKFSKELLYPELEQCRCFKQNENIYFFAKNYNILCMINLNTNKIELVGKLSNENFDQEYLVSNILKYKNEMICIPNAAKEIHVFDFVQKKEIDSIISGKEPLRWRNYCNAYLENNHYYLFPFTGDECIKIDLEQRKIVKSINIRKIYKDVFEDNYSYFSCSDCYMFENRLYMVMFDAATIVEMDIRSMSLCFYKMEGQSSHYIHVTGYKNRRYVLGEDGKIYIWNIISHAVENIIQLEFNERENSRYIYSVKHEKNIYIFKYIPSDEFIIINLDGNQAEVFSLTEKFNLEKTKQSTLSYMTTDDSEFYFLSKDLKLFVINFKSGEVNIFSLCWDEKDIEKYIKMQERDLEKFQTKPMVEGRYVWTLENYIGKYINVLKDSHFTENKDNGNRIFERIKIDLG